MHPDSQNAIDSVTAASVVEFVQHIGYQVEKRPVKYAELSQFYEIIAAGTAAALLPYRSSDQNQGGNVCVKLLQKL
ncbi:Aminotransferase lcsP [Penicillium chermesinum]|uniref:Aminotransferase lcsP n=1 Tax=Penicillium chermesinum TaxID=63820 RepID=A0A9W9NU09_9EURO|nr:Aminotransferase lcsP [Penicillium chermesinum]KAJ5226167.1 Aminotransferase lcsP [Penicillium chermesinum]